MLARQLRGDNGSGSKASNNSSNNRLLTLVNNDSTGAMIGDPLSHESQVDESEVCREEDEEEERPTFHEFA